MKRRISGEDSDTPAQGDSERFSILRARQVTCLAEHVKSTRNGRAVCADIVLVPSRLPEDIGTRIREFLQNCEGYKLEKHPGSDVEWGFQLVGESETRGEIKGTTEVFQPKNRTDYIAVTQKFELEDALVDMLSQLSEESQAQLHFELMTEVYRSDCNITINFSLRTPKSFRVGMPVYADALSQDTLVYRINKVHNTAGLLLAILNRAALNYSKKPEPKQL